MSTKGDQMLSSAKTPCADPNHESLDDQAGFVLRYIDECATGREVSDRDSHPMGKSNSEDSDDLSQEIGESLTNEGAKNRLHKLISTVSVPPCGTSDQQSKSE